MNAHTPKRDCLGIAKWIAEPQGPSPRIARWLHRHLTDCDRCRQLVLGSGRVRLAMLLVRTDPCDPELLMRANQRAIGVISRRLRDLPQADKLRRAHRRPPLRQRLARYTQGITHAAACLLILLLVRTGWLASLVHVHDRGTEVVERYFQRSLDPDSHQDSL
jgi:hypothetical protein